ncbi:MAG TPA: sigma-70 family RNA polymerase sigma factor [Vineibacter sp.]|nr:sigma-70 family RNA polymerase sigma factor [Vineibacter sp.]
MIGDIMPPGRTIRMGADQDAAASFDPLRPTLLRTAYRMLGSVADAEDVVQDAFIRWLATDRDVIQEPQAFLRRVVMRLCLDQLKSARRRREIYPGTWLPEPVVEAQDDDIDDVTLPLLMALERLSPLERAAFILHDVFGVGFGEIAQTIGRDPAACRQLASRARTNVRTSRPRFDMPRERGLQIAAAFFTASRQGDMNALRSMLAADVSVYSDGGGKKSSPMKPIVGLGDALKLHAALARLFATTMSRVVRFAFINSLPGFVTIEGNDTLQTTALRVENDRITGIYVVRNPDKLRHVADKTVH